MAPKSMPIIAAMKGSIRAGYHIATMLLCSTVLNAHGEHQYSSYCVPAGVLVDFSCETLW